MEEDHRHPCLDVPRPNPTPLLLHVPSPEAQFHFAKEQGHKKTELALPFGPCEGFPDVTRLEEFPPNEQVCGSFLDCYCTLQIGSDLTGHQPLCGPANPGSRT